MADNQQHNAIRSKIWLGGKLLSRDPVPVQMTSRRIEVQTRTSNLTLQTDRAFIAAGLPNVLQSYEFTLPWSDLREPALLEHLDILEAVGQPFDLGLWKQETDVFDGDATTTDFYLRRRQLMKAGVNPTEGVFADFETRVVQYDGPAWDRTSAPNEVAVVSKTHADIDSGGPGPGECWIEEEGQDIGNGLWVSKLRMGSAPPAEADCLVAIYLPLYRVAIKQAKARSYAQALVEPRTLELVEVG